MLSRLSHTSDNTNLYDINLKFISGIPLIFFLAGLDVHVTWFGTVYALKSVKRIIKTRTLLQTRLYRIIFKVINLILLMNSFDTFLHNKENRNSIAH
jgi:hypothetical protein